MFFAGIFLVALAVNVAALALGAPAIPHLLYCLAAVAGALVSLRFTASRA